MKLVYRKGQGSMEYIMLISSVILLALITFVMLQSNIILPASNSTNTQTTSYLEFTKCIALNLAPNGGFELDLNAPAGVPDGWTNATGSAYDQSGGHAYTGSSAINVTSTGGTYTSGNFNITALTNYILIAYAKSQTPGTGVKIDLEQYADAVLQSTETKTLQAPLTGNHQAFKINFTSCSGVPTSCNNAKLIIQAAGGALATVDNVCITKA